MFLRVGLQAENNVLDRMPYHFSGLKGVKMADLASLINTVLSCNQLYKPEDSSYTPRKLCLWEGILFSCCPSK